MQPNISYPHLSNPLASLPQPIIMLAPMAGVTDWVFRQLVQQYSAPSLVVSEMIASQSMVRHIQKTMLRQAQANEKIAVQLAGNDPEIMAEAARLSVDRGACLIDINMGCPVKKIAVNSYAGSALMKDLDLAAKIFRAIVKAVPVPVTVKMRKGWDDEHQNALDLIKIAQQEGLSYVTVHGRTRTQLFSGKADWDFIDRLQASIDFPIIGNGDINSVEDAARVIQKTSGIMIGRGSYGKPWFLGQVRHFLTTGTHLPAPALSIQKEIAVTHFQNLLTYYGTQQGLLIARKHLAWYSKGLPGAHEFRLRVFQHSSPENIVQHIENLYDCAENTMISCSDSVFLANQNKSVADSVVHSVAKSVCSSVIQPATHSFPTPLVSLASPLEEPTSELLCSQLTRNNHKGPIF